MKIIKIKTHCRYRIYLLIICFVISLPCSANESWELSTASHQGNYHPTGLAIKEIIEKNEVGMVHISNSKGSIDNIKRLINQETDLAIVQADILYKYQLAESKDDDYHDLYYESQELVNLLALFPEYFQILVRKADHPSSIFKLNNKKIYLGQEGSGSYKSAEGILKHFELEYSQPEQKDIASAQDAIEALRRGDIDAAFITSGIIYKDDDIKLLSISPELSKEFLERYPYYVYKFIGENENIGVFLTRATLVARSPEHEKGLSYEDAYNITKAIYENSYHLDRTSENGLDFFNEDFMIRKVSMKRHPGAEEYFDEINIIAGTGYIPIFTLCGLILGIMIFARQSGIMVEEGFLKWRFVKTTRNRLDKKNYCGKAINWFLHSQIATVFVIFSIILSLGIAAILFFEQQYAIKNDVLNPFSGKDWKDVLYWMTTFAATGFNQHVYPNSTIAKIVAISIPIIVFFGALFAILIAAAKKSDRLDKELRGVMIPSGIEDHIIICGWNARVPELIRQIISEDAPEEHKNVVVIADIDEEKPLEKYKFKHLDQVHYLELTHKV